MDTGQQITRPKHPGRQAAGKRLAEWNRKNKEDLLKNKDEVPAQVPSSGAQVVKEQSSHTLKYSGLGIILLICVAGGGIYFYSRKKTPSPAPEPLKKEVKNTWNKRYNKHV